MPPPRAPRATDDVARELIARAVRYGLVGLGMVVILLGLLIAPIPGPGGIPVIVVGLMIVLRNSFWARRKFVQAQRAHPKYIFPLRRLLRRDPEILAVFWQQYLRVERLVLPSRFRFGVRTRRRYGRKIR